MAQFNVGLPFLKTSFNPVSRQGEKKTASTAFVNAVMREMFDERIGRDKDIVHEDTQNNLWLIANRKFKEEYANSNTGEITKLVYTPSIEEKRKISDQDKLIKRDMYTADEYLKSLKTIIDDNNQRLKENGKRNLRKDCMSCIAGIIKVPMEVATQEGFDSEKFYKDSLEVLKELCADDIRCGEINAAVIHRDEYIDKEQKLKSDHLHYNIIPYCWEVGKDGQKFKSLNGKKFLNIKFLNKVNRNFPQMMRERGWEVADCVMSEDLKTQKEKKIHKEKSNGKDSIHYKAQAEREKEALERNIVDLKKEISDLDQERTDYAFELDTIKRDIEEKKQELEDQKKTIQKNDERIKKQEIDIHHNRGVITKQFEDHKHNQELIKKQRITYDKLKKQIQELLDLIKPLERLKGVLQAIRTFSYDFRETINEIRYQYVLDDTERKCLDDFWKATDEHDIGLDEAIDVAMKLANEQKHDQDDFEMEL